MLKLNLQLFGGRGGGSKVAKGKGGGGGSSNPVSKSVDKVKKSGTGVVPKSVRESDDWDTSVTKFGRTTMVELGSRDMNNSRMKKQLEKAGFTQQSDFRWTYEEN